MRCHSLIRGGKFLVLALTLAGAGVVAAHHDPAENVVQLTELLEKNPNFAELYFQRGSEFIALHKFAEARADMERCLSLQPDFFPACRSLARILSAQGESARGLELLEKSFKLPIPSGQDVHAAACHQTAGEIHLERNEDAEALRELDAAMALLDIPMADLVLMRAEALRRLGKPEERITCLQAAWEKNRSIVLRDAWLEAMIEGDRGSEVLPVIESELANTRFQSSWLIRRARVRLAGGQKAEAMADVESAIAELDTRIDPAKPAASLLADRALAKALLGNAAAAQVDVDAAETAGAAAHELRLVRKMLEPRAASP